LKEEELIQGLKSRDESAFKWLVGQYKDKIFNTVLNIVQDEHEADDCAQEVFIKVYENIQGFKGESALGTWIYRIAVTKALDNLRKRKTRHKLHMLLPWWMPEEKKSSSSPFNHPGVQLENKERSEVLFKAVSMLPEKQKTAFTLIRIQGLNYAETCEIMGLNIKAVESLISRAKVNLEKQLILKNLK
jgi:RNA polymerase sigma factor (sigma-70 family)